MEWTHTPKHEILTSVQAKRELSKVKIPYENLVLIKYSDAALRSLRENGIATEVGDVVRITRNSMTAGDVLYYRKIIP
jgi:DNA-directed RNA polymerase subunit H